MMTQSSVSLRRVGLQGLQGLGVDYYTAPTDQYGLTPTVITDPITVPADLYPIDYYTAPVDQYTLTPTDYYNPSVVTAPSSSTTDWFATLTNSVGAVMSSLFRPSGASSSQSTNPATQAAATQPVQTAQPVQSQLIAGIPNTYLAIGAVGVVALVLLTKRS